MKKIIASIAILFCCVFGYNFYLNMKINFIQNEIINTISKSKYLTLDKASLNKEFNSASSEIYFSLNKIKDINSMVIEIYYKKNFFHFRPVEVIGDIHFVDENFAKTESTIFKDKAIADFIINVGLLESDANIIINPMQAKQDDLELKTLPIDIKLSLNNFGKINKYEALFPQINIISKDDNIIIKNASSNIVFKNPVKLSQFKDFKIANFDFLGLDKIEELSTKDLIIKDIVLFSDSKIKDLTYSSNLNAKIANIELLSKDDNKSYDFDFSSSFDTKINFDENLSLLSYDFHIDNAKLNSIDENLNVSFALEDLFSSTKFLKAQNLVNIDKDNLAYETKLTLRNFAFSEDDYAFIAEDLQSYLKVDNKNDNFNFINSISIENLALNDENFKLSLAYNIKDFNLLSINKIDDIFKELPNSKFTLDSFELLYKNKNASLKAALELEFYGKNIRQDNILSNFDLNSKLVFSQNIIDIVKDKNSIAYLIAMQNLKYLLEQNYIDKKNDEYFAKINYLGNSKEILLNDKVFKF